ncbi:MAG: hypothetical protein IPI67_23955 [Myxococcales bacterium]|nr:hypothetical protein [Myxococcales bacterium]
MSDAIHISGAGPAGLAAAITIARAGGRAVVHERQTGVGMRFHGDYQGIENWTRDGDVLEELAGIGIEPTFDAAPFRELVLFGPKGRQRSVRSSTPLFYLVKRGKEPGTLDASLAEQAVRLGAELRLSDRVRTLEDGGIVAEGPRSTDAIAVGYVFETSAADGAYGVVSDELAPKGYAYLIVHAGRGTLATVLFEDFHSERTYLERTVEFYKSHVGIPMTGARRFGGRANAHLPGRATRGKLLYVGEAAGFQDALWGFGMRYAMLSGHLAGRALVDASPAAYDSAWEARLGGLLKTSIVNRYVVSHIGNFGYSVALALAGRSSDLRSWLHRLYAPSWWKRRLFPLAQRWARLKPPPAACVLEGCTCTWCRCQHDSVGDSVSGGAFHAETP